MSPRRKVDADDADFFGGLPAATQRRWGLPLIACLAALLIIGAIAASTLMLVAHEKDRRTALRDAAALGYVRAFMTGYTSLDPFHANDYTDRVKSQATGDFAKQFAERTNEIAIQVARGEPTKGSVLDLGVQRWSDNGSADVLVAVKTDTKSPDGKSTIESGSRWIATTVKEGQQWKISRLIQVI